jgi:protein-tyrosine phosphatase
MNEDQQNPTIHRRLRRVVPDSLLKERSTFLRLGPKAGPIYARLRLLDLTGIRSSNAARIKPSARSFLFVCFGNIMRSPMAEALLRKSVAEANLPGIRIASAGLHATPGKEPHPWALTAAAELGVALTSHHAQLLTSELVLQADAVFAMDFQNKAELLARYPESASKILMLSAYAEEPARYREILDPNWGDVETVRRCYGVLQICIRNLTLHLSACATKPGSPAPSEVTI